MRRCGMNFTDRLEKADVIIHGKDVSTLQQSVAILRGSFLITKNAVMELGPKSQCVKYHAALRLVRSVYVSDAFCVRYASIWRVIKQVCDSFRHKWKFINKDDFLARANNKTKAVVGLLASEEVKSEDR